MSEWLTHLWHRAESRSGRFLGDEIMQWPEGWIETALATGLLVEGGQASSVACDSCEAGHVERVDLRESPPGSGVRAYILCPESGQVFVPPGRLRQFEVALDALAHAIASGLSLSGTPAPLVPGRIWMLGRRAVGGQSREFFLGRGLTWPNGSGTVNEAGALISSRNPVVLVPHSRPPDLIWSGRQTAVVPIGPLATLDGEALVLDWLHIESQLSDGRPPPARRSVASFPVRPADQWSDLRIVIGEHQLEARLGDRERSLGYAEAGFENHTTGKPDQEWELLRVLGRFGGVLRKVDVRDAALRKNLKSYIHRLRGKIEAVFSLPGSSIVHRDKAFHCEFKVSAEEGITFPSCPGDGWDGWRDVTISELATGALRISGVAGTTVQAYERAADQGGRSVRVAAEDRVILTREFDLRMLGLVDADGEPTTCGRAVLEVLRTAGGVTRSAEDPAMMKLSSFLAALMGIPQPFGYDTRDRRWQPKFTTASYWAPRTAR